MLDKSNLDDSPAGSLNLIKTDATNPVKYISWILALFLLPGCSAGDASPAQNNGSVEPDAGTWQTWVLESGSEFRPPPPPAPGSDQQQAEIAEILQFQKERDTAPFSELFFWPEDPAGRPEPGSIPVTYSQVVLYYAAFNTTLWLTELNQKLFEYRWTENPPLAAYAYALTGVAFYDAFIATWDGRYTYWVARPQEMEPSIDPILPTYPSAEYPSGHSALSAAPTEVLAYLFPADAHYFRSRTRELAESRIWAGIHYRSSCEAGLELGRNVAHKVIEERGMRGGM